MLHLNSLAILLRICKYLQAGQVINNINPAKMCEKELYYQPNNYYEIVYYYQNQGVSF